MIPTKNFGTSGMPFSTVGLGTWNMETTPKESIEALHVGIAEGANHIDTAEMYGDGEVEKIVGQAIKGIRKNLRIVSKVLPSNARTKETIKACERSLTRLGTDYLDVYLLHWREKQTPIEETFEAFEKLKSEGKIIHWGVSNFNVKELEEALRLAGSGKIVCNQVLYHLKKRSIEFDLLPWCKDHDIALMGYSPLSQGKIPRSSGLNSVAAAHSSTPAQVILAYLTRESTAFTIPKSSSSLRTKENIEAMQIKLTQEEISIINEEFPTQPKKTLPML